MTTTFCVTFGQRYRREPHRASKLIHPDGWLEIDARSEDEARGLAVAVLGQEWSGLYPLADVGADYYPDGCIGVIFRCALCGTAVVASKLICPHCLPGLLTEG
ncbi:MAG: hypothetical protein KIT69_19285 [Propionibacteriaceae bacterium]|nr:hypothetical protein [Propionibacteriaceae bacterium]